MKKILRKIIFSAAAIYLISLWNEGFIVRNDLMTYLKASSVIALVYYLIVPVSKLVLLPLNLITFGMVSLAFYSFALYFLLNKFSLIQIKAWTFSGPTFGVIVVPFEISLVFNVLLVAFSISLIINLLEKII